MTRRKRKLVLKADVKVEENPPSSSEEEVPPPGWDDGSSSSPFLQSSAPQVSLSSPKSKSKIQRGRRPAKIKLHKTARNLTSGSSSHKNDSNTSPTGSDCSSSSPKCIICKIDISKLKMHRGRLYQKQVQEWKHIMMTNEGVSSIGSTNISEPCESCFKEFVLESWNISEQINNLQLILKELTKRVVDNQNKWSRENQNNSKLDKLEDEDEALESSSSDTEYLSDSEYDPLEDLKARKSKNRRVRQPKTKFNKAVPVGRRGIKKNENPSNNNILKMEPEMSDWKGQNSPPVEFAEPLNLTKFLEVKLEETTNVDVTFKVPLIIPGYEAVCSHCGTISRNLEHCEFCRTLLLKTAKILKVGTRICHLKSDLDLLTMKFPEDPPPPENVPTLNIRIKDELADDSSDGDNSEEMPLIKIRSIESISDKDTDPPYM
ncbi:uncharacterized protein LOC110855432 [Folsomia candida]|uniref:uncharacterized protein LOC110855432 n=1 Tax=Folsomia candida TaxID=158441 RepID=UPI001604A361|nr:uncharacterized protein LOC110855432 [Folsomia candida]XP_035712004.1 uncharacterized protein LOC110855432 [Folsomia candida]XP_035712005.1 uncharacterized protein LOC110855432 [Folsomia candida]